MDRINEFISLIFACIAHLYSNDFKAFLLTLGVGVVLAGCFWFICSRYSRLWNLKFHLNKKHHIFCALAALFTLVFTIIFSSMSYLRVASLDKIGSWSDELVEDQEWHEATFRLAYEEISKLGVEDFSKYPHPDEGGKIIPASKDISQKKAASIYSGEAVRNFNETNLLLSRMLWVPSEIAVSFIDEDIKKVFETSSTYPPERAIELATQWIQKDLDEQVPKVVSLSRILMFVMFVFAQSIPFGLVGYHAYRDLKTAI